jgi:hypothetical protein
MGPVFPPVRPTPPDINLPTLENAVTDNATKTTNENELSDWTKDRANRRNRAVFHVGLHYGAQRHPGSPPKGHL